MSLSPEEGRKSFLDPPTSYSQPKCYTKTNDVVKSVQCHELVNVLLSQQRPDILVCDEVTGKCVEVSSSDELVVTELSGSEVFVSVKEGDRVKRGDKLGYVITGKREVRSLRSDVEGFVVLVYEVPTSRPSKILVFIKKGGGGSE